MFAANKGLLLKTVCNPCHLHLGKDMPGHYTQHTLHTHTALLQHTVAHFLLLHPSLPPSLLPLAGCWMRTGIQSLHVLTMLSWSVCKRFLPGPPGSLPSFPSWPPRDGSGSCPVSPDHCHQVRQVSECVYGWFGQPVGEDRDCDAGKFQMTS